ncbi:MAG: LuxR C-terminal-related transcriptional regulator, partial [Cyanobacteria bacterium J06626_14]
FFSRVAMGAYKVGKIAQNRMPFLSNHLANESWVKDREWAIQNNIQGFAGYPIVAGDRVLGVLVTFSHEAMAPEFLEVLQVLGMTVGVALDAAMQSQQTKPTALELAPSIALSDQLSLVMTSTRLMLVGTERPLSLSMAYGVLRSAEILNQLTCHYCRLTYGVESLSLETIVAGHSENQPDQQPSSKQPSVRSQLDDIKSLATLLGGTFTVESSEPARPNPVMQCMLSIPFESVEVESLQRLSDREQEVMSMLAQGLRDREIAQQLYISESTVKFHIKNSLAKLNGKNRYQALYEAAQRRWI